MVSFGSGGVRAPRRGGGASTAVTGRAMTRAHIWHRGIAVWAWLMATILAGAAGQIVDRSRIQLVLVSCCLEGATDATVWVSWAAPDGVVVLVEQAVATRGGRELLRDETGAPVEVAEGSILRVSSSLLSEDANRCCWDGAPNPQRSFIQRAVEPTTAVEEPGGRVVLQQEIAICDSAIPQTCPGPPPAPMPPPPPPPPPPEPPEPPELDAVEEETTAKGDAPPSLGEATGAPTRPVTSRDPGLAEDEQPQAGVAAGADTMFPTPPGYASPPPAGYGFGAVGAYGTGLVQPEGAGPPRPVSLSPPAGAYYPALPSVAFDPSVAAYAGPVYGGPVRPRDEDSAEAGIFATMPPIPEPPPPYPPPPMGSIAAVAPAAGQQDSKPEESAATARAPSLPVPVPLPDVADAPASIPEVQLAAAACCDCSREVEFQVLHESADGEVRSTPLLTARSDSRKFALNWTDGAPALVENGARVFLYSSVQPRAPSLCPGVPDGLPQPPGTCTILSASDRIGGGAGNGFAELPLCDAVDYGACSLTDLQLDNTQCLLPAQHCPESFAGKQTCLSCRCFQAWRFNGINLQGCENPDGDPGGTWCKVLPGSGGRRCSQLPRKAEASGELVDWDYCSCPDVATCQALPPFPDAAALRLLPRVDLQANLSFADLDFAQYRSEPALRESVHRQLTTALQPSSTSRRNVSVVAAFPGSTNLAVLVVLVPLDGGEPDVVMPGNASAGNASEALLEEAAALAELLQTDPAAILQPQLLDSFGVPVVVAVPPSLVEPPPPPPPSPPVTIPPSPPPSSDGSSVSTGLIVGIVLVVLAAVLAALVLIWWCAVVRVRRARRAADEEQPAAKGYDAAGKQKQHTEGLPDAKVRGGKDGEKAPRLLSALDLSQLIRASSSAGWIPAGSFAAAAAVGGSGPRPSLYPTLSTLDITPKALSVRSAKSFSGRSSTMRRGASLDVESSVVADSQNALRGLMQLADKGKMLANFETVQGLVLLHQLHAHLAAFEARASSRQVRSSDPVTTMKMLNLGSGDDWAQPSSLPSRLPSAPEETGDPAPNLEALVEASMRSMGLEPTESLPQANGQKSRGATSGGSREQDPDRCRDQMAINGDVEQGEPSTSDAMLPHEERLRKKLAVMTHVLWVRPDVDLEVDPSHVQVVQLIGKGAFGEVYEAYWRQQDGARKHVAMKVIRISNQASESERSKLLKSTQTEMGIMTRIEHPHIVRCFGGCIRSDYCMILLELMEGRDLKHYVHKLRAQAELPLTIREVVAVGLQLSRALSYLHPLIIHADLKPENIMLDRHGVVKLMDFGLAKIKVDTMTSMLGGTLKYCAPEVFRADPSQLTSKCDIYSLGFVLWECLSGQRPWEEYSLNPIQVLYEVHMMSRRPDIPNRCPPKLASLIQSCWETDPAARPSAADLLVSLTAMELHPSS